MGTANRAQGVTELASFRVHFDGPITTDHKLPLRVLSKTYEHMQRAIDRAYLIEQYGDVWKHARLKSFQYAESEFLAEYPREGGIILNAVRVGAGTLLDRVARAVSPVFESATQRAVEQYETMETQLPQRRVFVRRMGDNTKTFEQVAEDPPAYWASAYSNRSVVKEIDQLVWQVTPEQLEGSTVEITLHGDQAHLPFAFTSTTARRFHTLAAHRELGPAMIVTARIRSLDRGNKQAKPSAKIRNLATGREVNLMLKSAADFDALHPFHNEDEVRLFVCPIIEALGFDINGGDLMFLAVA